MAVQGDLHPSTGITPPKSRPSYATYKSPYGPKYSIPLNISGWTVKSVAKFGTTLAGFGGVAGFVALYFLSDVPRFRRDIMQKIPFIGDRFIHAVPPSDNKIVTGGKRSGQAASATESLGQTERGWNTSVPSQNLDVSEAIPFSKYTAPS